MALTFGTLLSSQGTDAHRSEPHGSSRGNSPSVAGLSGPGNRSVDQAWKIDPSPQAGRGQCSSGAPADRAADPMDPPSGAPGRGETVRIRSLDVKPPCSWGPAPFLLVQPARPLRCSREAHRPRRSRCGRGVCEMSVPGPRDVPGAPSARVPGAATASHPMYGAPPRLARQAARVARRSGARWRARRVRVPRWS